MFLSMLPHTFLFSFLLIFSTCISLSASNWFFIWMGLELNMLSFTPMIFISSLMFEYESAMKYFLVQALGSSIFLLSSMNFISNNNMFPFPMFMILITMSMMLKLGLPPFHLWFPSVISSLSWNISLTLLSWQKIAPMFIFIMSSSIMNTKLFFLILSTSAIMGALGGLNQSQLRPLLAYSSMVHMSWMLMISTQSMNSFLYYFSLYIIISASIIYIISLFNTSTLKFSKKITFSFSMTLSMSTSIILLSLAGLPPLTGFSMKWLAIVTMMKINIFMLYPLIFSSLISLYFYLNLYFNFFLSSNLKQNLHFMMTPALTFVISSMTLPLFYLI